MKSKFLKTSLCVFLALLLTSIINNSSFCQVTGMYVERFYISDANDATDTLGNFTLDPGTVTYRIYVELKPGSRLRSIYGSSEHPLIIESTLPFYNNKDRPNAVFGYQMNKNWFDDNATIALDSWLTLGIGAFQSTKQYMGVPKSEDTDGSFLGGINNEGGSALIPGGILVNNDPSATPALTNSDGFVEATPNLGQWFDIGFKDMALGDTTVFGVINTGSQFVSTSCKLQQNNALTPVISNKLLVAQLTTKGEISLKLNVEVEEPSPTGLNIVKYVSSNNNIIQDTVVFSPFLSYPPLCGCKDPNFLEFSVIYSCNIQDSCKTPIRFGCMDTLACNFDPEANFEIKNLCCYPGLCSDRDLSIVCPGIANGRMGILRMFPNPVDESTQVEWNVGFGESRTELTVSDIYGSVLDRIELQGNSGTQEVSFGHLPSGIYTLRLTNQNITDTGFILVK
ncbi:MAG: T9SS type A sorting domain-containing protein [Bacteroidota bacterium]|jgi:hypothetical protein